jgi:hypothetical protein
LGGAVNFLTFAIVDDFEARRFNVFLAHLVHLVILVCPLSLVSLVPVAPEFQLQRVVEIVAQRLMLTGR